jgi:hypothetical protein
MTIPEHEVSKGKMHPDDREDSPVALCIDESMFPFGQHSISGPAQPNRPVCPVSLTSVNSFAFSHSMYGRRTLQKFHACLKAQQDLGKFKRLFKQNNITAQLDACQGELKAATQIFIVSIFHTSRARQG